MSKDRDRSRSPPRNRARERDRDRGDERRESYDSGDIRNESKSSSHRPGNSRFRDDRNRDSDGYRKDEEPRDYNNRGNNNNRNNNSAYDDQDHRRSSSNQSVKPPCRFFMMGNCNRNRCKFSHDVTKSEGFEERSHDDNDNDNDNDNNNRPQPYDHGMNSNRNLDDVAQDNNNMGSQDFSQYMSLSQFPANLNGDGKNMDMNGSNGVFFQTEIQKESDNIQNKESGKVLEASRNDIVNETVSMPDKQILADALELLNSLPNSNAFVSEPMKTSVVSVGIVDSGEEGNQKPVELVEKKLKDGNSGKGEEGDEKAMRQFKVVLVEFVKEILKPTWKEGKMSREVYKTIVKKVVEKVTSSIQGVQIPRTQEKIDQYLAFSKSKITKLVEAYVGRFLKA